MIEIVLGVAVFTTLVLGMVGLILLARSRLVAAGDADVVINDETTLRVPIGSKLLRVLTDADIHVPSACGGIGTCGQCRMTVLAGGGEILPIETARIARREVRRGVRLACQVTVRGDMRIVVPEEIFGVRQWECTVRSTRSLGTLIKEIVLELPGGEAMQYRAGAFVQIQSPPGVTRFRDFEIAEEFREQWDRLDLWRHEVASSHSTSRAYSMANFPDEKGIVTLIVRIAVPPPGAPESAPPGVVSSYLFGLRPGDSVQVSGPFGNFFAGDTDREMIFVGGGAGMAPLRAMIFDQLERVGTSRRMSFWYGARSLPELFYVEAFDRLQKKHENFRWRVALSEPRDEDHWAGEVGFIHDVLYQRYLSQHREPEECEYYLCGPPMLTRAVLHMLDSLGVERENVRFDDFGG